MNDIEREDALKNGINVTGWYALRAIDESHWLGDDEGVMCYKHHEIAKMAHAIIEEQMGNNRIKYYLKPYHGENEIKSDNIIMMKSAEEALNDLEHPKPKLTVL